MPRTSAKKDDIISVAEAERRYQDEWIVMETTHTDRLGFAKKGRLVAHSRDKNVVLDAASDLRKREPRLHLCLFYAGPVIPEGVNVVL